MTCGSPHFSAESEDSTTDSPEQGSSMCSCAKPTGGGGRCCEPGSPECRCTTTYAESLSENQRGELLLTDVAHQITAGGGKLGQGYQAVLISSAAAPPAKTSQSPDGGPGSVVNDPASSSKWPESSTLFNPDGFCGRTFPVSFRVADVRDAASVERFSAGISVEAVQALAAALNSPSLGTSAKWQRLSALAAEQPRRSSGSTVGLRSRWSAPLWSTSGTRSHTEYSTAVSSECRSDDEGCSSSEPSLTEILEPPQNVPARYSLSGRAARGILRRAEKRGRTLPSHLSAALEQVARTTTTDRADG